MSDVNEEDYEYYDIEVQVIKSDGSFKWIGLGPSKVNAAAIFEALRMKKNNYPESKFRVVGYRKVEIVQNEKYSVVS